MALYSSAAFFTSSIVGVLPPPSVATSICVMPISAAQSMLFCWFSRISRMLKCALSHFMPLSASIFLVCFASDSGANSA